MTRTQPYDPAAQGFPPRWDNDFDPDNLYFIRPDLRPYYHRSPSLDRDRVTAWRDRKGRKASEPFWLAERLWPPGGVAPMINPARRGQLEHALALEAASREMATAHRQAREQAWAGTHTCGICGSLDTTATPRGPLPSLQPAITGPGPIMCEPCAAFARLVLRRWDDEQTETGAQEKCPHGQRSELVTEWLTARLQRTPYNGE